MTSRRTSFSKEFETYKIGFLSTEQCKKIYERIWYEDSGDNVPEEEILDLEYIIENMAAGHTITVEFLAHLAYTKSWSVKRLYEELQSNGFRLQYKDEEDKLVNIQKSYEVLYDMSALTKAEQSILEAFSVFPYIPLSVETCDRWLLSDAEVSEDDDILMGLYRKGWLQFDVEQERYALHPVFAQFIYDKCKPMAKKHLRLIQMCQESLDMSKGGSVLECQYYIPFVQNLIEKVDMGKGIERADYILGFADLLLGMAEYEKAEKWYKISLKIKEHVYGKVHPDIAQIYNMLGGVNIYREGSEIVNEENLQMLKSVYGDNASGTIIRNNMLARLFGKRECYRRSLYYFFKAFRILFMKYGYEHLDTLIVCCNMEIAYTKWNPEGNFKQWLEEKMKESDLD